MFDYSKFSLEGKVAIITGASRGIGKAIASGLAKAGAKVVLTSRKINDLDANVAEIKASGGEAIALQSHLGKLEDIHKMVDHAVATYGRIDILVNNAGASPALAGVLETDERLWDTLMNTNLKGLYFISQSVARIMKKQGRGKIINISSIFSKKPEAGLGVYSISKAGIIMVTKTFAKELAPFNIQVNTISPGPIQTKMLDSNWFHLSEEEAKKAKEKIISKIPVGRIGEPDEIVGAVVYLASEASNYTTGAEIVVDGGSLLSD